MTLSKKAQRAVDRDLAMLEQTGRLEARTGAAPAQGRSSAPKGKGKATGSKTKAAASKGKGRASSGARGGSSATPVPDEEAMAKNRGAWDDAIEKLQALPTVRLAATASELERAAELAKWLIGHAYLRFAGPGAVHGVVNLTDDPNARHNPRALNPSHVADLGQAFSMNGGKQDRETPIYLKCPPDIIDPDCLAAMTDPARKVSARDLDFAPPALKLVRPNPDKENELETEVWTTRSRSARAYMEAPELVDKQRELDRMRNDRPRATLINGNHRTSGMLEACRILHAARDRIIEQDRRGELSPEDMAKALEGLRESVEAATYRCEVYRDDTPQAILAMLSENPSVRKSLAADRGEQIWSIGEWIAGALANKHEDELREDAMNRIVMTVQDGRGTIMGDVVPAIEVQQEKDKGRGKSKAGGSKKKNAEPSAPDEAGPTIDTLLERSTTVEMFLDTRVAQWTYTNLLTPGVATAMSKDAGACLVAHYWIGVRVMFKDAEEFALTTPLSAKGSPLASEHWENLHLGGKPTPTYLAAYEQTESVAFGRLLEAARNGVRSADGSIDWASDEVALAMRGAYERFAESYDDKGESGRRIAASLRTYARLPLWRYGGKTDAFYPAAALPAKTWLQTKASEAGSQQTAMGPEVAMAVSVLVAPASPFDR
ncbi:hypothetical protein FS749_012153 [Ceratobasidium sp. UAMH 11750]|nr:hypothetical protein FS749_012153 [Ceratobasidium sp. UAMH 11750]